MSLLASLGAVLLSSSLTFPGLRPVHSGQTIFVIVLDVTTSVAAEDFALYRDSLRQLFTTPEPRDLLFLLELDSDCQRDPAPQRFELAGPRLKFPDRIRGVFQRACAIEQRPPSYSGTTNIGSVLSWICQLTDIRQGTSGKRAQYHVFVFTDGVCDGPQSTCRRALPNGVEVSLYFLGVDGSSTSVEADLRSLCQVNGFNPDAVHFVPIAAILEAGALIHNSLGRLGNPSIEAALQDN